MQRLLKFATTFTCMMGFIGAAWVHADPDPELVYRLKASVVKVHVVTESGGHGIGTGVVVAPDIVATNCHIMAKAKGVNITKFGDSMSPVAMHADWQHDVCLLKFQYLNLTPAKLSRAATLSYGQDVFSIGFPGGPPKPQTRVGKVRALYPQDQSVVVRADASFSMGASGSPLFNQSGELVAMSTFKSPGRYAYYYFVPVEWIVDLMAHPPEVNAPYETAFWDQPPAQLPWMMQVVPLFQRSDWPALENTAQRWVAQSPQSAEAYYYLASALHGQGKFALAREMYQACIKQESKHLEAWTGLAILAQQLNQPEALAAASQTLNALDSEAAAALSERLQALRLEGLSR